MFAGVKLVLSVVLWCYTDTPNVCVDSLLFLNAASNCRTGKRYVQEPGFFSYFLAVLGPKAYNLSMASVFILFETCTLPCFYQRRCFMLSFFVFVTLVLFSFFYTKYVVPRCAWVPSCQIFTRMEYWSCCACSQPHCRSGLRKQCPELIYILLADNAYCADRLLLP